MIIDILLAKGSSADLFNAKIENSRKSKEKIKSDFGIKFKSSNAISYNAHFSGTYWSGVAEFIGFEKCFFFFFTYLFIKITIKTAVSVLELNVRLILITIAKSS